MYIVVFMFFGLQWEGMIGYLKHSQHKMYGYMEPFTRLELQLLDGQKPSKHIIFCSSNGFDN
jgi:hypothetical protein